MALFTIGYESASISDVLRALRQNNVATVLDVRQNPISRKPGFSKSALGFRLALEGLGYEHHSEFGCPRPIRDEYRDDGRWDKYTIAFQAHLQTLRPQVEALAKRAKRENLALMCFEADPRYCHRNYVAQAASKIAGPSLRVTHIAMPSQALAARRYQRLALA